MNTICSLKQSVLCFLFPPLFFSAALLALEEEGWEMFQDEAIAGSSLSSTEGLISSLIANVVIKDPALSIF
jgi:hypothetical protein